MEKKVQLLEKPHPSLLRPDNASNNAKEAEKRTNH
jgi:hypothetical protein